MNIIFVNSTRKWGGVKTWIVDYAIELMERGHHVKVYGRQPEFIKKLQSLGIVAERIKFGFDYNPATIGRFIATFLRTRPDVVIGNIGKDLNTAGVAASMMGIPVVQRVGLPGDMTPSYRLRFLHAITRPWMICPSQTVANGVFSRLPYIPRDKVKVIHNAKKPIAAVRSINSERLELISTSQVNADKGHEQVLEALADLPLDRVHYSVVGTGKLLDELQKRYKKLKEQGALTWHGFSTDVASHLVKADVFLLPSLREGMPNALLEAMAAGLIPISRDVGGVSEIWPDSLAEFLLPPESSSKQFQLALKKLLSLSPDELHVLKKASLAACRQQFNLNQTIQEFENWIQRDVCSQ